MRRTRILAVAAGWCALALAATACSAVGDTDTEGLLELLPSNPVPVTIPIDVAQDGEITGVGNLDLDMVNDLLGTFGMDVDLESLPSFTEREVQWYMDSGIQHVTLAAQPEGLFVLVNGEMLPAISWDQESLANLMTVLRYFERDGEGAYIADAATLDRIEAASQWLPRLNTSFALRFPVPAGDERIPLPDATEFADAFEGNDEPSDPQTVNLDLVYRALPDDAGWVPSLFGVSTVDVNQVLDSTGAKPINRMRLRRDIEKRISDEDIQSVNAEVRHDGIFLNVDDLELPHVAWGDDSLQNLAAVLDQLYPDSARLPSGYGFVPIVKAAAPVFNDLDLGLTIRFPTEETPE
jgi:hypothetical protein